MKWFKKSPTQEQYIKSVVKVATNLYISLNSECHKMTFKFQLSDSKYRLLIFCFSTVFTVSLVYDIKKRIQPDILYNGCINFLNWSGEEHSEDYFDELTNATNSITQNDNVFKHYLTQWEKWVVLESQGRNSEIIDLICTMLRFTETEEEIKDIDIKRLGEIALNIDCRIPTIYAAVNELARK